MSNVTPANAPIRRHIQINPTTVLDIDGDGAEIQKKAEAKKPFVRKPFLTDRPFGNNESLKELRDKLRNQQRSTKK